MVVNASNALRTTDYHAKFYAHQLARRVTGDSTDKLASSLADALVDLNPHQIDAALFAFQSPLSHGAILADEVGLGKTIEAGLVVSQFWAERKRQILIITPSNLRRQWKSELEEKFHLPVEILEGPSYNRAMRRDPSARPFDSSRQHIVIASITFAAGKEDDLSAIPWDLVVIDEAHRLRNADGKQAQRLKRALSGRKKLLLTATPLQNRIDELWGLASLVDEHFFGDRSSFRSRYSGSLDQETFSNLRQRLKPLVQRTLRSDATEFISYTKRIALLEEFIPTEEERNLYQLVSEYLRRDDLAALPTGQRQLITMVLRKLLASSTFAIAGALRTMANRLERNLADMPDEEVTNELVEDYDSLDETIEEWSSDDEQQTENEAPTAMERAAMLRELIELRALADQAESIAHNAKFDSLVTGLRKSFERTEQIGSARKAIIFTESRKTQQYIARELGKVPEFADGLVLFDGSNTDQKSKDIYRDWVDAHRDNPEKVSGSRTADIRAALVDYFRESGKVMIATEAAAEGINLQFCSLVINYDLPWNPQRIEQRIGRCHRYGQKYDVVVVNFLNKENEADQRVYELLDQKFHLFSGVFGATDEVLGTIGSGVDIERRIAQIYQSARNAEEINHSFEQMQLEMSDVIDEKRSITEQKLLEHFDEDVASRFAVRQRDMERSLDRMERALMTLTKHELRDHARFSNDRSFVLVENPYPNRAILLGHYDMPPRANKQTESIGQHYRPSHPLAEALIAAAADRELSPAEIVFYYHAAPGRQSAIERFAGAQGWVSVTRLSLEMDAGAEDHLLLAGFADDGRQLDIDQIETLFRIPGTTIRTTILDSEIRQRLDELVLLGKNATMDSLEERLAEWFDAEQAKLDEWAEDRRSSLRVELDAIEKEIRGARREARRGPGDLRTKRIRQQEVFRLTRQREELEDANRQKRRAIEDEEDQLLARIDAQLQHSMTEKSLFTIRWRLEA